MRKLTIKRTKSFVGSLGVMKVYIEAAEGGELTICDVSCKKLGELKNGEEVSFEIEENEAKLFVIADKLTADYCNDCYQLEAGSEDISLSGKNRFNPASSNAFVFDGNNGTEAKKRRKINIGKGIAVTVCAIIIGGLIGYGITMGISAIISSSEQEFITPEMNITLTKGFTQQNIPGYAAVFDSKNVDVFANKASTSPGVTFDFTEEEYAQHIITSNGFKDSKVMTDGDLTYFIFNGVASNDKDYRYYAYAYKVDDEYWLIQFVVKENEAKRYEDDIAKWAASVSFH